MVLEKYEVQLSSPEKGRLQKMIRSGRSSAQAITRARILLKIDEGVDRFPGNRGPGHFGADGNSSQEAVCGGRVGGGAAAPQPGQAAPEGGRTSGGPSHRPGLQPSARGPRPLDPASAGGQDGGTGFGYVLVPRDGAAALEKNLLKPWQKQQWCIPKVSADFVAHMEDVLDLYAETYDPQRPVVCFDETSTQLLADLRPSIPAAPGRPRREDYEYLRGGTRNLFLTCEPQRGWRACSHYPATHHAGLRPPDALAGG